MSTNLPHSLLDANPGTDNEERAKEIGTKSRTEAKSGRPVCRPKSPDTERPDSNPAPTQPPHPRPQRKQGEGGGREEIGRFSAPPISPTHHSIPVRRLTTRRESRRPVSLRR